MVRRSRGKLRCLQGCSACLERQVHGGRGPDLAAQLPLIIKGVYFDGWKPAGTPVKIRHKEDFFERVQTELRDYMVPREAVTGVFDVIKRLISKCEISDIKNDLPGELQDFF